MRITSLLLLAMPLFAQQGAPEDKVIQAFAAGQYREAEAALAPLPNTPQKALLADLLLLARQGCAALDNTTWLPRIAAAGNPALARLATLAAAPCLPAPDALAALERLQSQSPADPDILYALARFHLRAWNDAVFQMYQKAPASWRVNQLSAEILEIQGKLPEAEAEFRKAIAKNPTALNIHFRLGRVLLLQATGKDGLEAARAEFARELALNPSDAAAEFQLGQIANVNGDKPTARRHWQSALRLSPTLPEATLALAKLDLEDKRFPDAIALLEGLVARQPRNEAAQYNLMLAYRNSGQLDKAKARKAILDELQKPPEGEFSDFLKKLGDKPATPGPKP